MIDSGRLLPIALPGPPVTESSRRPLARGATKLAMVDPRLEDSYTACGAHRRPCSLVVLAFLSLCGC